MNGKEYMAIMIPQLIIALMFNAIFAGAVWYVLTEDLHEWSEVQEKIAVYLLGILSAGLLQILNYFFSSSLGSKIKSLTNKETT